MAHFDLEAVRYMKGERRMAAEVVMDGIEFISAELDLSSEVTQNQNQAPKIKRAVYLTHWNTKQDPNLLASVTGRRLHVQQQDKILRSRAAPHHQKGMR